MPLLNSEWNSPFTEAPLLLFHERFSGTEMNWIPPIPTNVCVGGGWFFFLLMQALLQPTIFLSSRTWQNLLLKLWFLFPTMCDYKILREPCCLQSKCVLQGRKEDIILLLLYLYGWHFSSPWNLTMMIMIPLIGLKEMLRVRYCSRNTNIKKMFTREQRGRHGYYINTLGMGFKWPTWLKKSFKFCFFFYFMCNGACSILNAGSIKSVGLKQAFFHWGIKI